ncbi:hypothetical protein AURDEDRAFT_176649 [Auricularia subglabra TFB-10046 SS5]|uniref:Uncharacterized protein n=1 Tax=Auricularia subglabra (strain TFB-10046 / SS5) TaxID=717982 RepID=J0WQX0_AURST|nr:hypothetical protein AURDEDRAFT_176649 [Auricularia subglabra TFB-10046 SS5]
MSLYDFDVVSVHESLSGFPGRDDSLGIPSSMPLEMYDTFVQLERFQEDESERIAALEAANVASFSDPDLDLSLPPLTDVHGHLNGWDHEALMAILRSLNDVSPMVLLLSDDEGESDSDPCPPARPSTPFPLPALGPYVDDADDSAPVTDTVMEWDMQSCIDPELLEASYAAYDAIRAADRIASLSAPQPDGRYVPPGRRELDRPRTFYPTLIAGVFDTEPPSEYRTCEFMAGT